MTAQNKEILLGWCQRELTNAIDNRVRMEQASRLHNPSVQYGESGKTYGELMDECLRWEHQLKQLKAELTTL